MSLLMEAEAGDVGLTPGAPRSGGPGGPEGRQRPGPSGAPGGPTTGLILDVPDVSLAAVEIPGKIKHP